MILSYVFVFFGFLFFGLGSGGWRRFSRRDERSIIVIISVEGVELGLSVGVVIFKIGDFGCII